MLKLEAINKSFNIAKGNEIHVLKDVNLTFNDTGLYIILGPSGSGKSTLLSLMGALDTPDSGKITYKGLDVSNLNEKDSDRYRQQLVSFIFQENNLIDYLSLKDNVFLKSDKKQSEIDEILKKLNIYELKDKKPAQLSGGEKSRVAIAKALLSDSEVILCDEPTASLDSKNAEIVLSLLKEISLHKLVIVVSHDERLCLKYSDQIIHIHDGSIIDKPNEKIISSSEDAKLSKVSNKIYKSHLFSRTSRHALHKKKETSLVFVLTLIAYICLTIVISLASGTRQTVDIAVNELLHFSPLTISSYYENITDVALINDYKIEDKDVINITQRTNIISSLHKNIITDEFASYITKNAPKDTYFSYNNDQTYSLIYENESGYHLHDSRSKDSLSDYVDSFFGKKQLISELIYDEEYFNLNYELKCGHYPTNDHEAIIVTQKYNQITDEVAEVLDVKQGDSPSAMLNKEFAIANHQYLYTQSDTKEVEGYFLKDKQTLEDENLDVRALNNYIIKYAHDYYEGDYDSQLEDISNINKLFKDEKEKRTLKAYSKTKSMINLENIANNPNQSEKIKIVGVASVNEKQLFPDKVAGILIKPELLRKVRLNNSSSDIAKEIDNHFVLPGKSETSLMIPNVFGYEYTVKDYTDSTLETSILNYFDFFESRKFFSTNNEISSLEIYTPSVGVKDEFITKIDQFNKTKDVSYEIKPLDLTKKVIDYCNTYFAVFADVLYAMSIIILVISSILSLVIVFNLVASRIKEIGIFRSSGYSSKYIFSLVETENVFINLLSSLLAIAIAYIFIPIANNVIANNDAIEIDMSHIFTLTPLWAVLIVVASLLASFIAALIPAIIYSKKKINNIIKM